MTDTQVFTPMPEDAEACAADTVVLIPAYDPTPALADTARDLHALGFAVLVVNDGSHSEYAPIFEAAGGYARIIGYAQNGGKGTALRYGIANLRTLYPDCRYFVTADADGQHAVEDILRAAALVRRNDGFVIGSREFTGEVPLRSVVGNVMSRVAYTCLADRYLRDNQSGLRAFPTSLCDWLLAIPGARYDYEMNVLMYAARQNVHIYELHMLTIYENNNSSSHFNPLRDTLRLHRRILQGSIPTLIGALVSLLLYLNLIPLGLSLFGLIGLRFAVLTAGSVGLLLGEGLTFLHYHRVADVRMHLSFTRFISGVFRLAAYQAMLDWLIYWAAWPVWAALAVAFVAEAVGGYWLKRFLARKRRTVHH